MTRVAINGFGRMGRLALRAAWGGGGFDIVHVNEPAGDAATAAHLLAFDSVHGRWSEPVDVFNNHLRIDGQSISYSEKSSIPEVDWRGLGIDLVLECSGKFKSPAALAPYFEAGVAKVIVAAPVKDGALNVVMGVNDHLYEPDRHHLLTAASCTTNCLAPIVKVLHEGIGIRHGAITTVHDVTNSQAVVDRPMRDLRRARSSLLNLIPTSTGSASAIGLIFPELQGRLDGIAVRVPLLNASLTDAVFELVRPSDVDEVNGLLRAAAEGPLAGILAYESRPLVSSDYRGDTHSATVDAASTMVTGGTQAKVLAWYDNEIGYVHRLVELTAKVARLLDAPQARRA